VSSDLVLELTARVRFERRPFPFPPSLRPLWGISVLCLAVFNASPRRRSSRTRLQVLYWAVQSSRNTQCIVDYLDRRIPRISVGVRLDPAFDQALSLAVSEQVLRVVRGVTIVSGARAARFVADISRDNTLMLREKDGLARIGSRLSEVAVTEFFK
jgi:hypothetical protein